jgi:uncharacterized protein (TIGR02266 family)
MSEASVSVKTIIIAADTAFVRDRFCRAIDNGGHHAVAVKSGAELVTRVRDSAATIDLIVIDLRLPPAPGLDLVRSLRAVDDRRLAILIFSGTITDAAEVRDLAALGVAGYIDEYSAVQHILPALAPHLIPDSFSRRASPRVVLVIPVQCRMGDTLADALMVDLSHGGMAIRTTRSLENGAPLAVRFRLPGSTRDIDAQGRVQWSGRRGTIGIRFEKVEAPSQALINTFVDAHFFSKRVS